MPIVLPVLAPAVVAGVFLFISWRLWRRRSPAEHGGWGGAVAFGGAFFLGGVLLNSWPAFRPASASDWHAWLALVLGVVGIAQRWWGRWWFVAFPVRLAVSIGFVGLLVQNLAQYTWSNQEALIWIGSLGLALTIVWESLERLCVQRPGASIPLALWALCAIAAGTFLAAGSALLGQLSGTLAAAFGAAVVLAWWAPGLSLRQGALTAFLPLYAGLLLRAYFFGELPASSAAILAATPLCLWIGERPGVRLLNAWNAALVRLTVVAIPAVVAFGIARWAISQEPADDYYY